MDQFHSKTNEIKEFSMERKIEDSKWIHMNTGRVIFIPIEIKESTIPNSGLGAFTLQFIPKNYGAKYFGIKKYKKNIDYDYSWSIFQYDKKTGQRVGNDIIHYIDASDPERSNWTRYVNCGMYDIKNNLEPVQKWEDLYYVSRRDINPGEELWIDYGEGFRNRLNDMDNENYYYG